MTAILASRRTSLGALALAANRRAPYLQDGLRSADGAATARGMSTSG